MIIVLWALGVPSTFDNARNLGPDARGTLEPISLYGTIAAYYLIALDSFMMVGFVVIAGMIFLQRPEDPMGVFVPTVLVLTGMLYTAPMYLATPFLLLAALCALAEICQVAFVYLFPDGRWVPRRAWLIILPLLIWRPTMWVVYYLPDFYDQWRSGGGFLVIPQNSLDISLFLAVILLGMVAQVYRYRRVSSAVERQQVKWLLMGVFAAAGVTGIYTIGINIPGVLDGDNDVVLTTLAVRTVRQLAVLLVPVSLAYSILRHRLWDIDILINRTLVYGTLTTSLALIYLTGVAALQGIVNALTGQQRSQTAVVATTLLSAALFHPLRRRIQAATDRRFYRSKYDASQTLARYGATLRDEVDLEKIRVDLLAAVQETMQPEHVSLWLPPPEHRTSGDPGRVPHRAPHYPSRLGPERWSGRASGVGARNHNDMP